jgi:hypothetical protein
MSFAVAQVPSRVNVTMSATVGMAAPAVPSHAAKAHHTSVATTAPAVPGPQGQKPAQNPVPIIIGKKDGRFINFVQKYTILFKKSRKVAKKTQKRKKFSLSQHFFRSISYLCSRFLNK